MKTDRRRKITPKQSQEIIRRRKDGESSKFLAAEFGLSRKTVDDMCSEALRPRARLSRRQTSHYLTELGIEPQNAQAVLGSLRPRPKKQTVKQRRLTAEEWAAIEKRHARGETLEALAEEYGVGRAALYSRKKRGAERKVKMAPMTLEQVKWLQRKMLVNGQPGPKRWKPEEVRELLLKKYGELISLRTFKSQLHWMGMATPGKNTALVRRRKLSQINRQVRNENERLILDALKTGKIEPLVRGRPRTQV